MLGILSISSGSTGEDSRLPSLQAACIANLDWGSILLLREWRILGT